MTTSKLSITKLCTLLICIVSMTDGLLVYNKQDGDAGQPVDNSTAMSVRHVTATFGAQQPYNITGQLVLLTGKSEEACSQLNKNLTEGKILLILRGGCTFLEKARHAQNAGAIGVVVGDHDPDGRVLYSMKPEAGSQDEISKSMPVMFIKGLSYQQIKAKILNAKEGETFYATLRRDEELSPHTMDPRHPLMPFMWLMLGLSYWTRKFMAHYIARRRRQPAVQEMPLVDYVPLDSDLEAAEQESLRMSQQQQRNTSIGPNALKHTSEASARQVINPTCTVCFEDFQSGEQIKALPCNHGFHAACIDPWLLHHSDKCPICARSILDPPINATKARRETHSGGSGAGTIGRDRRSPLQHVITAAEEAPPTQVTRARLHHRDTQTRSQRRSEGKDSSTGSNSLGSNVVQHRQPDVKRAFQHNLSSRNSSSHGQSPPPPRLRGRSNNWRTMAYSYTQGWASRILDRQSSSTHTL
mmetsp:Transcript_1744/g.2389  ORF Transcript_1744/g.2389 Transcript_1744/m.2389 type:complete len:470 (+) Transcript_1744:194-1603(+)